MNNKDVLTQQVLDAIADEVLHIETLEARGRDSLDFHDVSVGCVKDALSMAAYAGLAVEAELATEDNLDRHVELLGTIETAIPQQSARLYRIVWRVVG